MKTRILSALTMATTLALVGCGGGGVDVDIGSSFPPIRNTDFVASEPVDVSLAGTGRARLVLAGVNGSIAVSGAPAGSGVKISGERRVGSDSLADAQAYLPQLQVEVREVGDDIVVRTRQPQASGGRSFVVDYRITVPAALALDIVGVNGSIELSQMNGDVKTSLVNGPTKAALHVPAGAVIDMKVTNGDIDLHLPLDTAAMLSARVGIGTILVQDHVVHDEVRSNVSLQGRLGSGGASVTLQTQNGSIRIDGLA